MTKKDYELIARIIREAQTTDSAAAHLAEENWIDVAIGAAHQRGVTARALSFALEIDNPRFDRTKFLQACGIED